MKLYAKTVEPDLPAAALHEAAYALLFDALRADWQIRASRVERRRSAGRTCPARTCRLSA